MKKIILTALLLAVVILSACTAREAKQQSAANEQEQMQSVQQKQMQEAGQETKQIDERDEKPELSSICDTIISAEEFASICGEPPEMVKSTVKKSADGCWISFKHQKNTRLTAGLTITDWKYEDVANTELDRGLEMRRQEASNDVGERNYGFAEVNRDNYVWVRGTFITKIGASNEICSKEKLLEVANAVDDKLY